MPDAEKDAREFCDYVEGSTQARCHLEPEHDGPTHRGWAHYPGQLVSWPNEPRHMPCDMGCQPDWHHDDCAIYLPVAPIAATRVSVENDVPLGRWFRRTPESLRMLDEETEALRVAESDAPFLDVPEGIDIARYFWHEIVMADQDVPYRRGQYHDCDGIDLWREGRDYCYLWVEATVDHDMWMAYLLEVRTSRGGVESRDHLYLAAGGGDLFEVEWRNQPIRFDASLDEHIDHHRAAMLWFVERDVGTIEEQNGGDAGIIARAAATHVLPPRSGRA